MNADAIIDQYEDLWRKAALDQTPHFGHGRPLIEGNNDAPPTCALLVAPVTLQDAATDMVVRGVEPWICPECGEGHVSLSCAMIHLNNVHRWIWDRFANKFREAWHEGLK